MPVFNVLKYEILVAELVSKKSLPEQASVEDLRRIIANLSKR